MIKLKFISHHVLHSSWTYLSLSDSDLVLGLKIVVSKVSRVMNEKGEFLTSPDGNPVYNYQTTIVSRLLTKEEYSVIKQLRKDGDEGD